MGFSFRTLVARLKRSVRWGLLAAALFASSGLAAATANAPQSGLDRAVAAVREQRYADALAAARAEPDALLRSQAELYVFHQAGSLDEALAAGMAGLQGAPDNAWLLEQTAFVALTLGLGARAAGYLETLEQVAPGQAPEWMVEQAGELSEQRADEQQALERARRVALAVLAAAAVAIAYGARGGAAVDADSVTA